MKTLTALLLLTFLALPAGDFSGNWAGTVAMAKGDYPISFSFKVSGNKLEETMLGTDGTPFTISDGKIDGETITFAVTLTYPGKSLQRNYKGVLHADEIHFTVDQSGQGSEFVVKKAK